MTAPERKDTWASGAPYEPYVGRWSRLVAREFLGWLAIRPGACWLDIGCGTGALSQTILEVASPQLVVGVHPSQGYLVHVSRSKTHVQSFCWEMHKHSLSPHLPMISSSPGSCSILFLSQVKRSERWSGQCEKAEPLQRTCGITRARCN